MIDWAHFTPWSSLAGGLLIGVATAMLLLFNGRVAGITGILGGLLRPKAGDIGWRLAFVLGLLGAPLVYGLAAPLPSVHIDADTASLIVAGLLVAAPAFDRLPCADVGIEEGTPFKVGSIQLQPLHTPGHTAGHFAYWFGDKIFSGDALLIEGCGRTDFQNGDAEALYKSVTEKLFSLPYDTLVYPAHDYQDRRVSSIAQEKKRNPRIGQERTLEQFREIMANLNLPYPKFIDYAVPGNQQCGICPDHLPQNLEKYCRQMTESPQG